MLEFGSGLQPNLACSPQAGKTIFSRKGWGGSRTLTLNHNWYLESNIQHKQSFPQKRKSWTWKIDLWLPRGRGEGMGWMGSLGLIDADYCLWNGLAMRSCCVAPGTMFSHLWWSMIMWEEECIHVCVTGSPCCIVEKNKNNVLGK